MVVLADGAGASLELIDTNTPYDQLDKYFSWQASNAVDGTPAAASSQASGVVINEVLAHTDAPQSDAIELFNSSDVAVDISGWWLSDSADQPLKFQIPAGTLLAAGGYIAFDESDFNPTPATPGLNDFALSSNGEELVLSQGTGNTVTHFEDGVEFGATFNGESLGRLPNGTGRLARLASNSVGSVNGEAEVGPLVISEVNYHPNEPSAAALSFDASLTEQELEYIEIANPTNSTIDLTNWRIRGEVDFDFAADTSLAARAAILVVSFDPTLDTNKLAAFAIHHGVGSNITIVGGWEGSLSNSVARISLQQPDLPDADGLFPHVVVDEVVYNDVAPWPDADGSGQSLTRDDLKANGNFASSWIAATPTPGIFEADFLLGDVNQDGIIDFDDISPFITLLQSGTYLAEADTNEDGIVDFDDISPFVILLASGD